MQEGVGFSRPEISYYNPSLSVQVLKQKGFKISRTLYLGTWTFRGYSRAARKGGLISRTPMQNTDVLC